mmetsp:Transcript_24221/g.76733  ORF Transcript_24221/g.76733 Transcript_24221/m.76733 type:complete len:237 (+) Transcript_24221:5823-6533(+)
MAAHHSYSSRWCHLGMAEGFKPLRARAMSCLTALSSTSWASVTCGKSSSARTASDTWASSSSQSGANVTFRDADRVETSLGTFIEPPRSAASFSAAGPTRTVDEPVLECQRARAHELGCATQRLRAPKVEVQVVQRQPGCLLQTRTRKAPQTGVLARAPPHRGDGLGQVRADPHRHSGGQVHLPLHDGQRRRDAAERGRSPGRRDEDDAIESAVLAQLRGGPALRAQSDAPPERRG